MSEKVEKKEVKKEAEVKATSTKSTWWNRICSAIVGAVLAVGSMFGITTEQVKAQKAKTEEVKTLASEALESIKSGDIKSATAKLQEVAAVGKAVVNDVKKVSEAVKNSDKEEVKAKVVEAVKTAVKQETKAEKATTEKKVEAKKAEAPKTEAKK